MGSRGRDEVGNMAEQVFTQLLTIPQHWFLCWVWGGCLPRAPTLDHHSSAQKSLFCHSRCLLGRSGEQQRHFHISYDPTRGALGIL